MGPPNLAVPVEPACSWPLYFKSLQPVLQVMLLAVCKRRVYISVGMSFGRKMLLDYACSILQDTPNTVYMTYLVLTSWVLVLEAKPTEIMKSGINSFDLNLNA